MMLKLKHAIICVVSGLMLVSTALAESSALKKLIDENQDRVAGFFGNIDTSRSGMENVSAALDTGCLYTASKAYCAIWSNDQQFLALKCPVTQTTCKRLSGCWLTNTSGMAS